MDEDKETELKRLRQDNVLLKRALQNIELNYRAHIVGEHTKTEFIAKVVDKLTEVQDIYKK